MEWLQPKRRGPKKTASSVSTLPFHLLTVFFIVIFLLWCSSSYSDDHLSHSIAGLKILLLLFPVLVIFLMALYSNATRFFGGNRSIMNSAARPRQHVHDRQGNRRSAGFGIPWGMALTIGLLLVSVAYHSSIQSKWFSPLRE